MCRGRVTLRSSPITTCQRHPLITCLGCVFSPECTLFDPCRRLWDSQYKLCHTDGFLTPDNEPKLMTLGPVGGGYYALRPHTLANLDPAEK